MRAQQASREDEPQHAVTSRSLGTIKTRKMTVAAVLNQSSPFSNKSSTSRLPRQLKSRF